MKTILVTGSNGLLGQKLVELLTQQPDKKVIATARGENRLPFKEGYDYFSMDITKPEEVASVIQKTMPDVIVHGAAMTNVGISVNLKKKRVGHKT